MIAAAELDVSRVAEARTGRAGATVTAGIHRLRAGTLVRGGTEEYLLARLRTGPGPGTAFVGAAPAGRQDASGIPGHGRFCPRPADPQPGGGAGRPRTGPVAGLRPGRGGRRLPLPRPGPPSVRPQRGGRARTRPRMPSAVSKATPRRFGCSPGWSRRSCARTAPGRPEPRPGPAWTRPASTRGPRTARRSSMANGPASSGAYEDELPVFNWLRRSRPGAAPAWRPR